MSTMSGHDTRPRPIVWLTALVVCLLVGWPGDGRAGEPPKGPVILHELRAFDTLGSVLYVAAHPDDENTHAITYLARGRGYRTAYLSLTRGDGGQNLLGPQLGDALGVARTQELLAARRLDGGQQYFTRARDFGYSKDYRETLRIWGEDAVLADVVRVIRAFRPDVILTRFSPTPGDTHGHHTASAVLAVEAFKLAGDPSAFPEQLGELAPWQPKRILHNRGGPAGAAAPVPDGPGVVRLDVRGIDAVLGESFASIAARSRGMHKTQGFGMDGMEGPRPAVAEARTEGFLPLGGEPATHDLFDGIDTTWSRVAGGAEIGQLTDQVIARFDPGAPEASVPALLAIRRRLSRLPAEPLINDKRRQLDRILQACLGLEVETTTDRSEVVAGETVRLRHIASVVRSSLPVRWVAMRYSTVRRPFTKAIELRPGRPVVREASQVLPRTTPPTQPYWLRHEGTAGLFRVDDASLIGRPEDPPVLPLEYVFEVGGQTLVVPGEPVAAAEPGATTRRRLEVIPPVSLRFTSPVELFAPGAARPVTVEVTAAHARVAGVVQLEAPSGWSIAPASQPFRLAGMGDRVHATFTVTPPGGPATVSIQVSAEVDGVRFSHQRIEVRYDHIPFQLLHPPAMVKTVSLDLATRGRHVGYLPGAGDEVARALERMGYAVTQLNADDLTAEKLRPLDAVVIGVRAFNVRTDLAARLPALFAYVEAGGTLIAQYNLAQGLAENWLAPFQMRISRRRVTDEQAPVTLLAPDHPALTTPNRITDDDFKDWVQERGLYFPEQWDERFTPLLATGDPGETPLPGGLLVARQGRGHFVYTSLAWFRQLPEGVPGAYRLFANLVSLGK
jgi:LmbE family N-acetylglucosaminyl deacetylase